MNFHYASIDIETTGTNPEKDQIIQIGIVLDDFVTPISDLPCIEYLVRDIDDRYTGSPFALQMNAGILKKLADIENDANLNGHRWAWSHTLADRVEEWLRSKGWDRSGLLCAGKNFASFDAQFLRRIPYWEKQIKPRHRCLDPGSMFYRPDDGSRPPGLGECLWRAGIKGPVKHTALADAFQTVELIRAALQDYLPLPGPPIL